ncbi:MAG: group II intron reverse transcriptase/maturase [Proteobacteria bacterium]|nr:group II intron reverse transcriptase/maturase [Pseudomonadota bacterium]
MRTMPNTEMGKTEFKLSLISEHAERDKTMRFTSLAHLLNVEFLRRCFNSLNRNKAVGQDNVSWHDYAENLDDNLNSLMVRLKRKSFKPIPARRVYIPKSDGKSRPLGISATENKIVERGIAWILESIYERDFSDVSFGFRPKRDCHQALKKLNDLIMFKPVNHIDEADIKGFFDNVSHEHLMDFLRIRIKDSSLLFLIERFLKAGYVDDGLLVRTEKGTPQGSILSPILANVFLHYVLDQWFEDVVKNHTDGYCELVRYADDFVCVVQYERDAKKIERALRNRFNRFGLEIHPEKSRRISFGRFEFQNAKRQNRKPNSFDFLGFTHFCDRTRKGAFKVGRKTAKKKFAEKCKDLNHWLKNIRNHEKTKDWWKVLASKVRGHYQYYGVSGNYRSIGEFYEFTKRTTRKWMNRRSQKGKMSWKNFSDYIERYPIPKPKIKHNFYTGFPCFVR